MTDTQPTKFCVGCKHYSEYFNGPRMCLAPQREKATDMVTGVQTYVNGDNARRIRENECKGEWWEEADVAMPATITRTVDFPEIDKPITFSRVPLTAKTYKHGGIVRPSIFQRIKRWFG